MSCFFSAEQMDSLQQTEQPLDEEEQLDLIHDADHLAAVIKPVALTMALAA